MLEGQVVDTESAKEFMKEALTKIDPNELDMVAEELAEKSRRFTALLGEPAAHPLDDAALLPIFKSIFSVRRKAGAILDKSGGQMGGWIADLLFGDGRLEKRFETFCGRLPVDFSPTLGRDLAGELLHYTEPEKYWLWTRWMWDERVNTGALPLVTIEGVDLEADTAGGTYIRVGEAVSFVRLVGEAAGFARIGRGPHGVYVYLACVYAVYMYTTLRIRMTQEFNKVVPELPELIRRLLGTYRIEV